jgi:release factor glutamine methyltransferase
VDLIEPGKRVLDVGCGSGVITVFAALKSEHVTAIDISPQALENTRLNCREHGIENVTVKQSDMYSAVDGRFDYIISYPPLFQVEFESSDRQWCTSTNFVEDIFRGAHDHLVPDGKLVILLPEAFRSSVQEYAQQSGLLLESASPHTARSFATRVHSIPYLHFNMNNHVFVFRRPS